MNPPGGTTPPASKTISPVQQSASLPERLVSGCFRLAALWLYVYALNLAVQVIVAAAILAAVLRMPRSELKETVRTWLPCSDRRAEPPQRRGAAQILMVAS